MLALQGWALASLPPGEHEIASGCLSKEAGFRPRRKGCIPLGKFGTFYDFHLTNRPMSYRADLEIFRNFRTEPIRR